jgi:hypothetical protein
MHFSDNLITRITRRWKMIACIVGLICSLRVPATADSLAITFSFSGSPTGPPTISGTTYTLDALATGTILSSNAILNATWNPVTNHTHDVIDLTTGMNNGSFSLTFADGSTLFGNLLEDDSLVLAGGGTGPFTQTLTFTGGTDEFLGATGSMSGSGFATASGFSASGSGTLNAPLVPEPGSAAMLLGGLAFVVVFRRILLN